MALNFYASKISENLAKTPEGFLVAPRTCLGRTGFQVYEIRELPADALKDLGIDTSNPNATIQVYRSPEEVFHPAAMASLEGKPVTFGHPPGEQFVDPSNFKDYAFGHVQNIQKGDEALDAGDWPLLGDVILAREPLLGKVESGELREISIGYDFTLAREGDRIVQTDIRGNHVAVVPRGRAGAEARINDSAPAAPERNSAGSGSTGVKVKEEPKVSNILRHLLGLGLKAYAADADPEKLAEAAEAIKEEKKADAPPPKEVEKKPAEDRRADDRRTDDKKVDDVKPKADDRRTDDKRARFHSMLDRMLDEGDRRADDASADDADIAELRELLDQFLSEEEGEPEHQEGEGAEGEGEEVAEEIPAGDVEFAFDPENQKSFPIRGTKGYSRAKAGDPPKGRGRDGIIEPVSETLAASNKPGALDILQALRPLVARSKDADLRRAFNAQLGRFTRSSRPSEGSYTRFSRGAATRAADANTGGYQAPECNVKLQAAYDAVRVGRAANKEGK